MSLPRIRVHRVLSMYPARTVCSVEKSLKTFFRQINCFTQNELLMSWFHGFSFERDRVLKYFSRLCIIDLLIPRKFYAKIPAMCTLKNWFHHIFVNFSRNFLLKIEMIIWRNFFKHFFLNDGYWLRIWIDIWMIISFNDFLYETIHIQQFDDTFVEELIGRNNFPLRVFDMLRCYQKNQQTWELSWWKSFAH